MPDIEDLLSDLKAIKSTIQDGVDRAMLGDTVDIVQVNKDQLLSGFDINNNPLGQYAPSTKKIRERKGLQTGHIDLSFTGRSQDSLNISKLDDSNFEITSEPQWDQKRFPDAIGIAEKDEQKVTDIVIENVEAVLNELLT